MGEGDDRLAAAEGKNIPEDERTPDREAIAGKWENPKKSLSDLAKDLFESESGALKLPNISPKGTLFGKVFAPEKVSSQAENAAALIREKSGIRARDVRSRRTAEPFRELINSYPESNRISFMKRMDSGTQQYHSDLQPLADKLRGVFNSVKTKIQALPGGDQVEFLKNYFPHMWKNEEKAGEFLNNFFAHQGSAASLKNRIIPTIQDGLDAGLKLASSDPIEIGMRYLSSMHNYIEATDILNTAQENKTIKTFKKPGMGASGHPEGSLIPTGWAPLQGRGAGGVTGVQWYAPEDWARVYNNYVSNGLHSNLEAGKIYDALRKTSNAVTTLELGLSGYHAFTMGKEAIISDVAKGISQLAGGNVKGLTSIATSPLAPVTMALRGRAAQAEYLNPGTMSPQVQKVVDLITRAGGRMASRVYDPTYEFSKMGSYWTAFKRGALRQQLTDVKNGIKDAYTENGPVGAGVQTGKELFSAVGRVMQTAAQPIFEKYIPAIKNGAYYDLLSEWVNANPAATDTQQLAAARRIGDSVDNRFGEMIQDNIFWNKTLKQAAMLGMRSYSWNLGTLREIGGGIGGLATGATNLSMASANYDPRAAYVIAMPMVVATASAAYQYLKTGEGPQSTEDLMAPRTGGRTAVGAPERAIMPGYEKDVYGWFHSPSQEAFNKMATAPRLLWETLANKDYRGLPIANENAPLEQRLEQYLTHVGQSLGPISIKQFAGRQVKGTNISLPERATGTRAAPTWMEEPGYLNRVIHKANQTEWKKKLNADRRQQQRTK